MVFRPLVRSRYTVRVTGWLPTAFKIQPETIKWVISISFRLFLFELECEGPVGNLIDEDIEKLG